MALTSSLDVGSAASILRDSLRDKSYRSTPLGLEAGRYIRWKRSEWGATPETIRDYESILARTALFFADLTLKDFETPLGADRLRECWDYHWGEAAPRTRAKVLSVWRDFFDWAIIDRRDEEGRQIIHGNPARMIRSPKKRGVKREPYQKDLVQKIVQSQDYLPHKLGVRLVLQYALRRAELAAVQFKDFDFERHDLVVTGKGGKIRRTPILHDVFWRELAEVELELGGRDSIRDWFLIARRERRGLKTFSFHNRGIDPRSMHTWWYDRLEQAGLCGDRESGTRVGLGMHRGRHTVATRILKESGNMKAASEMLGHKDYATTDEFYAEFDTGVLESILSGMYGEDD